MPQPVDMIGRKFSKLTVAEFAGSERRRGKKVIRFYWCICECEKRVKVSGVGLRHGGTRSCGCLKPKSSKAPAKNPGSKIARVECLADINPSDITRFWSYVNKNGPMPAHCPELGPCWIWTGAISHGYGNFYTKVNGKKRYFRASRFSYLLAKGAVDSETLALHHCDNRQCVNDTHLYGGGHQKNADDAVARKRVREGSQNPTAKLNESQVIEIRALLPNLSQQKVAKRFGVSQRVISKIARRETWDHVA